jgi:uncharacterized protein YbcV (DUF1398 family)
MTEKYGILLKFFPNGVVEDTDDHIIAEMIMNAIKSNNEIYWEELSHRFHKDGKYDFEEYCLHMADALVRRKLRRDDLKKMQG